MISKIKLTGLMAAICLFTSCNNDSTTTVETKKDSSTAQPSNTTPDTANAMRRYNAANSSLMTSLDSMLTRMKNMQMTGDFDIDFANMMTEHHRAAIDMSEKELGSGGNEQIKNMAQKIITTQQDEIIQLQDFVKTYKPSGQKRGEKQLRRFISYIQSRMISARLTGNMDKDFAIMMSAHHDASTAMARNELVYGVNDKLKQMAQKIITTQTEEIKEFKNWLNNEK